MKKRKMNKREIRKNKTKVALVKGNNRYGNIIKALSLIEEQIRKKLKGKNSIIIKPNCVSDNLQLASTHVDSIKAILDIITKFYRKRVTIAEGSAHSTKKAFKNFNYYSLAENYNVDFFDLNKDSSIEIECYDENLKKMKLRVAKRMIDSDCIISVAKLKTHNAVIATFSIKNVVVGSLIKKAFKNYKERIHQGTKSINLNIFEIAKHIWPSISVIDGFIGMEGNGPTHGMPVKMNLALVGIDALSVDNTAAHLIGINPDDIGYLYYCKKAGLGNTTNIKITGNTSIKASRKRFRLHDNIKEQLRWH